MLPLTDRQTLKDATIRLRDAEAKASEKLDTQKALEEMDGDLKRLREEAGGQHQLRQRRHSSPRAVGRRLELLLSGGRVICSRSSICTLRYLNAALATSFENTRLAPQRNKALRMFVLENHPLEFIRLGVLYFPRRHAHIYEAPPSFEFNAVISRFWRVHLKVSVVIRHAIYDTLMAD
jgi:hypothetical protein